MQYKDYLVDFMRKKHENDLYKVLDGVTDSFYDSAVKDYDQELIDIAFNPKLTQAELDSFLAHFDIEAVNGKKTLVLAYTMKNHPNLDFGVYSGPRLSGFLNFHRFANLELIASFTKIVRKLNEAGVKPMIIKGGAMKYLRPELPRVMGDIDIIVSSVQEYQKSIQVITDMGYDYVDNEHAIDVHEKGKEEGLLDIHQFIELGIDYDHKFISDLFARAKLCKVFSCDVYVPQIEDLAFILLMNMVKNLHDQTSMGGVIYTLFDYKWLSTSKADFDYNSILENVKATNTSVQMMLGFKFINRLVKGMFDENKLKNNEFERDLRNYLNREYFYQIYVRDVKYACKKIKLKSAFSSFAGFRNYMVNKVPHFFTKRIMKSQFLINLFLKFVH